MQQQVSAQTQWLMDGTSVPAPINQIMVLGGVNLASGRSANEVFLMLGHAMPPMVDTNTLTVEAAANLVVPIVPVGHFSVSYDRVKEFHAVLGDFIAQQELVDQQQGR